MAKQENNQYVNMDDFWPPISNCSAKVCGLLTLEERKKVMTTVGSSIRQRLEKEKLCNMWGNRVTRVTIAYFPQVVNGRQAVGVMCLETNCPFKTRKSVKKS